MPVNTIGHEAISASAGSGKTFELAHRYIRLLARGVTPESIVALTFSRKAAGEISDSIVRYLCDAASSEVEAQRLAQRIRTPGLSQAQCLFLLRTFIERLHLIRLGTLDSFTAGILRSFPFELGIPPGFQLLESGSAVALAMQQQILEQMSLRSRNAVGKAIRQASYGRSNKRVDEIAGEFVSEHQSWIRVLPEADRWGTRSVIWPRGTPWLDTTLDVETAADTVEGFLAAAGWTAAATEKWREFVAAARRYSPYSRWDHRIDFIFKKLAECCDALSMGSAEVKINRASCPLEGDIASSVMTLMQHLVRTELETALKRTQGIHRLLSIYEEHYDAAMRREGRLSFIDAQYLLTEANKVSGGAVLSRTQGSPTRLYIDYRLDARLDHWMLDEFQDTSDLQWQALENLIDEVVQDASGSRSLFYVGDVKQAIYGWRGGNPRLFQTLVDRYGDAIAQRSLKHSHRSCQAIIDTVNRVFGQTAETALPRAAVSLWESFWETHECAAGVPQNGCAMVIEPSCDGGERTPAPEDRHHAVARLLQHIQPLARGLSTAVLVRTNDQGRAVVDCLRTECPEMTVVHEGVAAIKDNPVVALLLSLVTFAAHPGDTLAWRHIQMSPLQGILGQLHLDADTLSTRILKEAQAHGFQRTLRDWGARLDRAATLDAFGRIRLEQLLEAAGEFDAAGGTSCDEFLNHIDHFELRDAADDDAIRVMTVHQSKGLGFDVVILPELERQSMTAARNPKFVLARDEHTQSPRWALQLPRRAVAECDETVRAEIEKADANAAFESLCVLYVAMTRAKKGLYLVTSFPGKSAQVFNQPAFVKTQLVGTARATESHGEAVTLGYESFTRLYCHGDERWYTAFPERAAGAPRAEAAALDLSKRPSRREHLVAVQPSQTHRGETSAASLFHPERRRRRDLGLAVHALMQQVSWVEETDVERTIAEWEGAVTYEADVRARAIEQFTHAMASPGIRALLSRPEERVQLWRERSFDVVLGNRWVTGTFDRVVVRLNDEGRALSACIYDFKTDDVPADDAQQQAALYHVQLSLYREALSRLLRIPAAAIRAVLIFTAPGMAHELAPSDFVPE